MSRRIVLPLLALLVLAGVVVTGRLALDGESPRPAGVPRVSTPPPVGGEPAGTPAVPEPGDPAARTRVTSPGAGTAADQHTPDPDDVAGSVYEATDTDTVPLAGVTVTLLRSPPATPWFDPRTEPESPFFPQNIPDSAVATTTTDAEGDFAFPDAPRGCNTVRLEAPGYRTAIFFVSVKGPWSNEFELQRSREICVVVLTSDRRPVEGARVLVANWLGVPPHAATTTDAAGRATFDGGDIATIHVSKPGHAAVIRELEDDDTVVLPPERRIAGVVVDTRGDPVPGALVRSYDGHGPPSETSADGRFELRQLAAGGWSHDVRVVREGYSEFWGAAVPGNANARFVLEQPTTLSGLVLGVDGTPARGLTVRSGEVEATTTEQGRFTFRVDGAAGDNVIVRVHELLPQEFDLGEFPRPYGVGAEASVALAPGSAADAIVLRMQRIPESYVFIRGLAPDGTPLTDYHIGVDTSVDRGLPESQGMRRAGWFRRVPLEPGTRFELTAVQGGRDDLESWKTVEMTTHATPDGTADDVVFDPVPFPGRTGQVTELTLVAVGPDGEQLPDGTVESWALEWYGDDIERAGERPDGAPHEPHASVRIARVQAGQPVRVQLDARGYGTRSYRIENPAPGALHVECRVPRAAVVTGRVATPTPRQSFVEIEVRLADGGTSTAWFENGDGIDEDGSFRADRLAGGDARVTIWDSAGECILAERTFRLPDGGRVDLGELLAGQLPWARGTVVRGTQPVGGVIIDAHADEDWMAETSTASDGTFALEAPSRPGAVLELGLVDGSAAVAYILADVFAAPGARLPVPARGDVRVGVEGGLPEGAELTGHIVRVPGGPRVVAWKYSNPDPEDSYLFELGSLPLGVVEIVVTARGSDGLSITWTGTADVTDGEDDVIDVTLQR